MASDNSSVLSDCSSPLSTISFSPSPPPELRLSYPSPPSSQDSDLGSPDPDGMDSTIIVATDKDGVRPTKKRRISERKTRSTEYLDLQNAPIADSDQEQLDRLMKVLHKRRKIVVVVGAGISVSAGIPDFRSSTGLFTSLRAEYNLKGSGKHLFDASVYKDESSTESFHHMVKQMSKMTKHARPTVFHQMLATLAAEGRLLRLYTQNVDGIDTAMEPLATTVPLTKRDGKWPKTVQLHGGLDKMVCSKCNDLSDFDPDLFDGPLPPICDACVETDRVRTDVAGKRSHGIGRLRPRMVLYNEHNPDEDAIGHVVKEDLRKRPDAILVVGTSLKIPGVQRIVREMCATVRDRRDGVAVWINNDPEPVGAEFKDCWDIVVRGTSDEVARHAALRHWTQGEGEELTAEEWDEATKNEAQVVINRAYKPVSSASAFRRSLASPDYSPLVTRTSSLFGDGSSEADDMVAGAPPTPSKSRRSSPVKPKAKVSAFDAMKDKKTTKAPASKRATTKPASAKPRNRKPATTATSKTTTKPLPKPTIRLNQTMVQKKSLVARVSLKSEKLSEPIPGSNNKRKRTPASSDPVMRPVSPENARVNSAGAPVESKGDISDGEKIQKRMSLERVLN